MAFPAYASSKNNNGVASVAVDKPTSLAVGDIMAGHVVCYRNAGSPSITTPAGWTAAKPQTIASQGAMAVFLKRADASDVAAANFTFVGNGDGIYAAITRITVDQLTSLFDQSDSAASNSTTGITPTVGNGLLMIFAGYTSNGSRSVSTYAIATNNPTWTEAYDLQDGVSFYGIAMAYASRGRITATGVASWVLSSTFNSQHTVILNITPKILDSLVLTSNEPRAIVQQIQRAPLVLTSHVNTATQSDVEPDWVNEDKSANTDFINTSKS